MSVTGHDADHRVLVLGNPKLQGRVASVTNIVGAIQCVMPGERTSPHRHTPAAVRVVLEGAGGEGIILSVGGGTSPGMPRENIVAMLQALEEFNSSRVAASRA